MERNNKRYERYKTIYDTFEPFRQAKKETIHSIISYGKKHPVLKYPILLGTVAFIFVYNVILHFLIQMHVREKLARGLAFLLAVIMVITSVDVTAFAMKKADENEKKVLVSQIMDLEDAILTQEIAVGDSVEKIVFPDYLEVLVQEEVEEEETSVESEESTEETLTESEATIEVESPSTEVPPSVEEPEVEPEPVAEPEPIAEPEPEEEPEAEVVDAVSKEDEERLSDAVGQIQDKVPNVVPGPYIQLTEVQDDAGNENGNRTFTLNIPDELEKEGRTYYLVTVDENGNIVILQNESIVDGMLTFTGVTDATYQIVYEDGTSYLADMLNENGYLVDENGNMITVNTNHCFWHYIIFVLALIGIALSLFFRDRRKNQLLAVGIVTILMLILTFVGWCIWDVLFTIFAEVIMVTIIICLKNKQDEEELEYE